MNILKVLQSGEVTRYHNTLISNKQNNSQHSWEVAIILRHIYPECSVDLLSYALTHDAAELLVGDIPAPVKRLIPGLKETLSRFEKEYMIVELGLPYPNFTDEEMLAVKWADILSGVYFTSLSMSRGDTNAGPIREVWIGYANQLNYLNNTALETLEALK